ncbi:MAG: SsrA-binding protein SmpB [Candidatus Gracilibacteria bacterium]|nr:SsrA-binding protein SmpB [Candidatus Gracilibacteria bacterium]
MNENKLISKNKKAYFDYEILDSREAGIELKGYEVKSIRKGNVNLKGAYVSLQTGDAVVRGMHISALENTMNKNLVEPARDRNLFLHKKTINLLREKSKEPGKTVIPLEIYTSGNLIKIKVGLVMGRKEYNKKQLLKERTLDKEAKIMMKKHY